MVTIIIVGGIAYVNWVKSIQFLQASIEDFHKTQHSFATQAAHKVEFSFAKLVDDLYSLSQMPEVQFFEKNTCLLNMVRVQKLNSQQIDSIFRTDAKGILRYSYPRKSSPVDEKQLHEIFEHCRMTGKSLFQVVRERMDGTDFLVIAQPVYTVQGRVHLNPTNKFSGILYFITTLNQLQKYFFSSSLFGERGYPWIITPEKLIINTANTQHLGEKFDDFLPNELSPAKRKAIEDILAKMVKGETGQGRYTYRYHQGIKGDYDKLVAYMPIHLPDQTWSIGVSSPISDVLAPTAARLDELRSYSVYLSIVLTLMALLVVLLLKNTHKKQIRQLQLQEEENRRIRQEWQITFDCVDSMVFLLSNDLTIIRANSSAAALGKGGAEELIGRNFCEILEEATGTSFDLSASLTPSFHETISQRISCPLLEKIFLATFIPVADKGVQRVDVIGYLKDISEIEELQEQYHRAQKMESIGMIAGGVAHDLNNILSGIVTYPELILMDLPDESELKRPVEMIYNSGKRAAAVVDDLLTVARGVAKIKKVENLNTIIVAYIESLEFQALQDQYPKIDFITKLAADLSNIECSSVHIQKSLMNLITNSAESIENEGRIIISTKNIHCGSDSRLKEKSPAENCVLLSVADSGAGIAKKDLDRIFEPFYSKKVMGRSGTGLGLAVVWNTIEDHGGHIDVFSDNSGTTFSLYLPACEEQEKSRQPQLELSKISGSGERILVVDDQELQREIAVKMLESVGYEVATAQSGEYAITYLQMNKADLVLLDMIMDPGMNGCETYEKILDIYPEQKAIIISGYSADSHVKKALQLGAAALIKKPYTIEQLGIALKTALSS